jgi:peptidoglycan/LPS O-acetylase OafA/YrhL
MPPWQARRQRTAPHFRPEIQGLRALAVLAVILNHLTGWPGGGFVGVDIFFVVSGFLITGLLLAEQQKTGRISLRQFYVRRIRRILPASALVLVVTVLASFYLLNAGRGRQTLVDGLWSLFFSANWHFAAIGTDYFQAAGPRSPFEHFWSLAVEEQFYLVWPGLVLAVFVLASRAANPGRFGRILVGAVLVLIVGASLVHASTLSASDSTWAYFSTFTRGWELGVGALLAVTARSLASIPAVWRPRMAWGGLAAILVSFVVIDESSLLPGPWALLPVLSASLIIAAGTGGSVRYPRLLTHPASVWFGELSYSLYLWHFPVIVLLASLFPEPSPLYYVSCLVLILGLSVAAFYGLEDPVRKSSWLTARPRQRQPGPEQQPRPLRPEQAGAVRVRRPRPRSDVRAPRLIGVGCLTLSCLMFVGMVVSYEQTSNASGRQVAAAGSGASAGGTSAKDERSAALATALSAREWPKLVPGLDGLRDDSATPPCATTYGSAPLGEATEIRRSCVQGDRAAAHTVLVVGDSLASSYVPGVLAAVEPEGWNVIALTRSGCPALKIEVLRVASRRPYPDCTQHQDLLGRRVAELKPDLIVVTNSSSPVRGLLASGATGDEALSQWGRAVEVSVKEFAKTAPVVVLQGPPRGKDLNVCATRFSAPADCVSTPPPVHAKVDKVEKKAITSVDDQDVRYVRTQAWFCSKDGKCPGFVGTTPTFVDGGHLTPEASRSLAALIADALDKSVNL